MVSLAINRCSFRVRFVCHNKVSAFQAADDCIPIVHEYFDVSFFLGKAEKFAHVSRIRASNDVNDRFRMGYLGEEVVV